LKTSLREVRASCLPFPAKSVPIDDYISWFGEEVKVLPGAVWQLNDNFVVLAIKGVLNMLHSSGCHELSGLHDLAASSDASVLNNVPTEVQKIAPHRAPVSTSSAPPHHTLPLWPPLRKSPHCCSVHHGPDSWDFPLENNLRKTVI
jgi:hypothetical protein